MPATIGTLVLVAGCTPDAVSIVPPQPIGQVLEQCDQLNNRLPAKIAGLHTRPTNPQSSLTHAWGSPPITLICGVPRPKGYSPSSSSTLGVNGVQWFQQIGKDAVVWTAIRPENPTGRIYVALRVPTSYPASDGFLTALADPLKIALP